MNRSASRLSPWVGAGLGLSLLAADAAAQEANATCVLRGRDTVLASGATVKQCLDLDAMAGRTYVVPSNVVRVDSTGFSLCETSATEGGKADIVYVMDQSGSMRLRHAWVSPDQKDTVWLHSVDNCRGAYSPADQNNHGTITVRRGTGTAEIRRLNPAKDPRKLCFDYWSGDPYYQRDIALRAAIDFQAARAPESRAGYLGFSGGVSGAVTPRALNTPANVNAVKSNISIINDGATNYLAALDQAKKWLTNTTLSPNPTKAVIFVSDGKPSPDSTGYLRVLDPAYAAAPGTMPPVYGIFLGVPRPDTIRLADLSRATGGRFYLIPPDRPDSLRAVVEQILNVILKQYQPSTARIFNAVNPGVVATASSTDFTRQEDGSWLMRMDRDLPLIASAPNLMDAYARMREINSGDTLPKSALFTLSTTGPEERTNKNLATGPWSIVCTDLPPPPNLVRKAYIRDTDNDGAGDKVFFEFTRPLEALPGSVEPVYWNQVAPGFANKLPPKLTFLPGSSFTVVVADFTASPFPQGLTSIPPGQIPHATLPNVPVFVGQKPPIEDSIGPVLMAAQVRPFDNRKSAAGGPLNVDTLLVTLSEPIESSGEWKDMLRWGKSTAGACKDYEGSTPLVLPRDAVPVNDSMTTFRLFVTAGNGPTPMVGDCVYMDTSGTYTDRHDNIPATLGKRLEGTLPPRLIEVFRGYPPVVGYGPEGRGFVVANQDTRDGKGEDWSAPDDDGVYKVKWVPPVGWPVNAVPGQGYASPMPAGVNTLPAGTDLTTRQDIPLFVSTVQVISTGRYIADVSIFDNQGRFMKRFKQSFGYFGELNNEARRANRGLASYLVWDLKDSKGVWAGQGVYVWKVVFTFEGNKEEIMYTRTGLVRNAKWFLNQGAATP